MTDGKAKLKHFSGTLGYNAPEVTNDSEVTEKIDIWSFGICLYEMAVAYKPTVLDKTFAKSGNVPFRERDWRNMDLLKDLISKMLKIDANEWIGAKEALTHAWFEDDDFEINPL